MVRFGSRAKFYLSQARLGGLAGKMMGGKYQVLPFFNAKPAIKFNHRVYFHNRKGVDTLQVQARHLFVSGLREGKACLKRFSCIS